MSPAFLEGELAALDLEDPPSDVARLIQASQATTGELSAGSGSWAPKTPSVIRCVRPARSRSQ